MKNRVLPVLPLTQKKRAEIDRFLRGREDFIRLKGVDGVVVSYEKSGRTWLRVMLSRFYQQRFSLPDDRLVKLGKQRGLDARMPTILFTHDRDLRFYTGCDDNRSCYEDKRIVLLVRDPRDVAVSFFFHWKNRMKRYERLRYLLPVQDMSIQEFVFSEHYGLAATISFMNRWHDMMSCMPNIRMYRYEDLRKDTVTELANILEFVGADPLMKEVEDAVAYAAFEKMKKRESVAPVGSGGLSPGSRDNADSYKTRRAKIGGYRDYFSEEEVRKIDELVATTLHPGFGYS